MRQFSDPCGWEVEERWHVCGTGYDSLLSLFGVTSRPSQALATSTSQFMPKEKSILPHLIIYVSWALGREFSDRIHMCTCCLLEIPV